MNAFQAHMQLIFNNVVLFPTFLDVDGPRVVNYFDIIYYYRFQDHPEPKHDVWVQDLAF